MNRRRRILFILLPLVLIGVGALIRYVVVRPVPEPLADPGIAVEVRSPERDTAWVRVPYHGTLEGERDATLSFRLGGEVARLHVRVGDEVASGALLAELNAAELEAVLARARADLARARAQEAHWEGELKVDDRLFEVGAVSRSRLEATRLSHRSSVLAREGAEAAVTEVEARTDGARIRATHPGIVGRVEVSEGEGVVPGQPILTLMAGERQVRVEVLERDRVRGILPGTLVHLAAAGCASGEGRVTTVDAAARSPFGATRVVVAPAESCFGALPPGTSVEVTFRVEGTHDALFVPLSAVDFRGGAPRVFRLTDQETVEAVPVTLGTQRGDLQEIQGPVNPHDRLVVVGTTNLRSGDRVWVVGEGAER
ncbi:MAG: efflux RND transporter periplasmic adaptor subunit [Gemmatimonadota bacterium]